MPGVCRVLKEVHPDVGISKQAMQVMNAFAGDMFDKIMKEATKLTQVSKKATLSSREIQTAGEHLASCVSAQLQCGAVMCSAVSYHVVLWWACDSAVQHSVQCIALQLLMLGTSDRLLYTPGGHLLQICVVNWDLSSQK